MKLNIGKIELKISFLFCILLALLIVFDRENILSLTYIFVFLHESAHILTMILLGQRIKSVSLEAFGIFIQKQENKSGFMNDFLIMISGCLFNLFAFVIFYLLFQYNEKKLFLYSYCINFILFAFNILPIKNLDGGDITELILNRLLSTENADKSGKIISFITSIGLLIIGMILCLKVGFNLSLIITSLYLLFKSFMPQ